MLHKVEIACLEYFQQVEHLQTTLLAQLCEPGVTQAEIDENWVQNLLMPLKLSQNWIHKFCTRKNSAQKNNALKLPMLDLMKVIADLEPTHRHQLLSAFRNDVSFYQDFENSNGSIHKFQSLDFLPDSDLKKQVRDFFQIFYEPLFGTLGYEVRNNNQVVTFNRKFFHEQFLQANTHLEVCPMCDGQRNLETEVDHFYSKSDYPFLACHAYNLTPICENCNGAGNKGSQIPMELNANDPKLNWFHPYLRPLTSWVDKPSRPNSHSFSVEFSRINGKITPEPTSQDCNIRKRLEKLEGLVHFKKEWTRQLTIKIRTVGSDIDRLKRKGKIQTKEQFIEQLKEWSEKMDDDIGLQPYSILMRYYYEAVAAEQPELFDELWVRFAITDPLLAA